MNSARPALVWDLPVRFFHWLLAATLTGAAFCAFLAEEHSAGFAFHAVLGLILTFMVLLRILYGLLGSRYARFTAFHFRVAELRAYARGVFSGRGKRFIGHNPASSYAIVLMLALVLGLAGTGIMLGRGMEAVKEIHETLALSLLSVVALHIVGVVLHTIRHRENITASMIHGRKQAEPDAGIASTRPLVGFVFLFLVGLWSYRLVVAADPGFQRLHLPVLGWTLSMDHEHGSHGHQDRHHEGHDDD